MSSRHAFRRSTRHRRLMVERLARRELLAVDFQFDFSTQDDFGFNDPELGTARREALERLGRHYGSQLQHDALIHVDVTNGRGSIGGGALGYFSNDPPVNGFQGTVPYQKLIASDGTDPNGFDQADGLLQINWVNDDGDNLPWSLDGDVGIGEVDFRAVVFHELTHLIGISSDIRADGGDAFFSKPAGEPGVWQPFDRFVADRTGVALIDPSNDHRMDLTRWSTAAIGNSSGDGLFFSGPQAVAANGGNLVPLHSPNPFQEGESVIHLRIDPPTVTDATHLILPAIRTGTVANELSPLAIAMLADIGIDYEIDNTPPTPLITTTADPRTSDPVVTFGISYDAAASADFDAFQIEGGELRDAFGVVGSFTYVIDADVTEGETGEVSLTIPAGTFVDLAGNESESASLSVTVDRQNPQPTFTKPSGDAFSGEPVTVTVDFGEQVRDFTVDDLIGVNDSSTDAIASNVMNVSGSVYTFEVTKPTPGQVLVNVAAGSLEDVAGNANDAADSLLINFVDRSIDLQIELEDSSEAVAGAGALQRILIRNDSSVAASNVIVSGNLPAETEPIVSTSSSDVVFAGNSFSIPIGILDANATVTRFVAMTTPAEWIALDSPDFSVGIASDATDSDPSNDTASTTISIRSAADLGVAAQTETLSFVRPVPQTVVDSEGNPMVVTGFTDFQLVIRVRNQGPSVARNVALSHQLVDGIVCDASQQDAAIGWTQNDDIVSTTLAEPLLPGESQIVRLRLRLTSDFPIPADAPATADVTVQVSSDSEDLNAVNDTWTLPLTIFASAGDSSELRDDVFVASQNEPLPITGNALTGNDGIDAVIESFSDPVNGQLTVRDDTKRVVYRPASDFVGTDTFTYSAIVGNQPLLLLEIDDDGQTRRFPASAIQWSTDSAGDVPLTLVLDDAASTPALLSALSKQTRWPRATLRSLQPSGNGFLLETHRWTLMNVGVIGFSTEILRDGTVASDSSVNLQLTFDTFQIDQTPRSEEIPDLDVRTRFREIAKGDDESDLLIDSFGIWPLTSASKFSDAVTTRLLNNNGVGTFLSIGDRVSRGVVATSLEVNHPVGELRDSIRGGSPESANATYRLTLDGDAGILGAEFLRSLRTDQPIDAIALTTRASRGEDGFEALHQQLRTVRVLSFKQDDAVDDGPPTTTVELAFDEFRVLRQSNRETLKGVFAWSSTDSEVPFAKQTPIAGLALTNQQKIDAGLVLSNGSVDIPVVTFNADVSNADGSGVNETSWAFTLSDGPWADGLKSAVFNGTLLQDWTLTRYLPLDTDLAVDAIGSTWTFDNLRITDIASETNPIDSTTEINISIVASEYEHQTYRTRLQFGAGNAVTQTRGNLLGDFIGEPADLRNPGMVSPDADLIRFNERSADGSSGYVLDSINVTVDADTNVPTFQISTSDAGLIQMLVQATLSRTKINSASLIDRQGSTSDLDQVWFLPNSTVTEISWDESNTGPSAEFTLAVDAPTSVTQEPIVFRSYLNEVDSGNGDFREIEVNLVSETVSGDGPAEYLDEGSYVEQIGRSLFISNVTDRERGASHHLEPAEVTFSLPAFGADAQHATVNLMFDDSFGLPEFVAAQFSGQQNDWLVTLGNNFNVGQSYQLIDAIVSSVDVVDSIDDGIDGGSFSVTIEAPRVNVRVQEANSTGSPLEGRRIDVDYQRNQVTNALNLEVLPNTDGDTEVESTDVSIFDQRARLNHGANSLNSVFLVDEAGISFRDLRGEEGTSSLTASPWLLSTESLAILPALISEVLPGSSDLSLSLESLSPISQDLGTSRLVDLQQSQLDDLNWSIGGDVAVDIRFSATPQTIGWQQAIENEMNETLESASWQYNIVGQNTLDSSELPELDLSGYRTASATVEVDVRGFVDDDDDQISSAIENAAPGSGDGNGDGVQDASQINVASLPNPVTGAYVTLQAPLGQSLQNVSIDAQPDNVPPAELDFRVGVLDYEVSGVSVGGLTQLTIYVDGASGFNTFYKFGPTATRPTPHYYRFLFDGEVGAEFFDDRIVVHLKDGALGDDDLMANGIIVDPGAPTVNVSAAPHQNPLDRFDVTEDGDVTALDALRVINQLNRVGGAMDLTPPSPGEANEFVDVSGDSTVSALDALQVINELNRRSGLAEPEALNLVIGSQQSLTTNASDQDAQGQSFEALEPILNRVDKATVATDAFDTRTTRAIDVNVPVEAEKFASDSERLDLHDRIIAEWEEVAPTLGNQNPVGH